MDDKDIVLKIENVSKSFGRNIVLEHVNLDIISGEIFGIIGISGSGKTTLLNLIIGFHRVDNGDIKFKRSHLLGFKTPDKDSFCSIYAKEFELKRMFGFAAQKPSFYKQLNSDENLDYFGSLYGLPKEIRRTNSEILLKLMGIYDFRKLNADQLSGGMQKRLDIACALIHNPSVLILDEPTADLDPISRKQMWDLIRKINSKGTTVVITSHLLEELEELCDRVAIIHNKKIIRIGSPNEIKNSYSNHYEIKIETKSARYDQFKEFLLRNNNQFDVRSIKHSGRKLLIISPNAERILHNAIHHFESREDDIIDVSVNKPLLEEVMTYLIRIEDIKKQEEIRRVQQEKQNKNKKTNKNKKQKK